MSDATEKPRVTDATKTAWIAAAAAIISALIALGSAGFSYLNRDRELDIKLVEIGIGILRTDPEKSGVSAARQWAIDIIETSSGLKFNPDDRAELLNKPLGFDSSFDFGGPSSFDFGGGGFSSAPSAVGEPSATTPKAQPK